MRRQFVRGVNILIENEAPNAVVTTTIRRPFDCLSKVIEVTVT